MGYVAPKGNQFAKGNPSNKTSFRKGHISWTKGKKGLLLRPAGWKHTEEIKNKLSEQKKEFYKNNKVWNKGKTGIYSEETKKKMSESHRGDKSIRWQGGITSLNLNIRKNFKYRQWRSDVFTRDNFICRECNAKSKNDNHLEAHHLKEFNLILKENNIKTIDGALNCEELWNINNGITLCENCHRKTKRFKLWTKKKP